jgi:hypothetical protein
MASVGGDIIEIGYNHPVLGSGTIFPKAAEDSTYDLGGLRSDDEANGVDGSGEPIRKMNRVRWSFEVSVAWDMNTREDLEKLTALAAHPQEASWTFSHINGTVYGGKGFPVGDMNGNANAATFKLKVAGGKKLSKQ